MENPANSDGFIPFAPRCIAVSGQAERPATALTASAALSPVATDAAEGAPAVASPLVETPLENVEAKEDPDDVAADVAEASAVMASIEQLPQPSCNHEQLIRNLAIEFAIVACGRGLRHAVMVHPLTIARFVDEALVATGRPSDAIVSGVEAATFSKGQEILVDCGDSQIVADLHTMAELLVRAAANA